MSLNSDDYKVNMNDDRLTAIKTEESQTKNDLNNTYNSMINNTDKFYQDQIQSSKDYEKQQADSQNEKTQQSINEINQQKEQTQADYTKEQKGAYNDYMQQANPYGNQAEKIASMGIQNSGVSESDKTSMYNTYQNRVATARDTLNRTNMNFDNKISEAKLSNNTAIADIYANAAKEQAQTLLQGFQYKNTLIQTKANQLTELGTRYDNKYLNTYNQINTELQNKREVDQSNENYKLQMEQIQKEYEKAQDESKRAWAQIAQEDKEFKEKQRQWQTSYNLQKQENDAKIASYRTVKSTSDSSNSDKVDYYINQYNNMNNNSAMGIVGRIALKKAIQDDYNNGVINDDDLKEISDAIN